MKTEVYSWRVSADIKTALEREARRRRLSLSAVPDLAASEWLKKSAPAGGDEIRRIDRWGAILALLDKSDRWHKPCVAVFEQLRLPLLTCEAVLTELFHLVG